MIRWYDYFIALLFADLMQSLLFTALTTTVLWQSFVFGLIIRFMYDVWMEFCKIRFNMENKNGN